MSESIDKTTTETSTISTIFTSILKQVCEETQWEYGEVWLPKTDTILELNPAWYVSSRVSDNRQVAWAHFRDCSESFILRLGEGLAGRVWDTQTSEWIADVSAESESYFLRNQIAKAFGAKAGFGIPIVERNILAILVFFMSEIREQDMKMIAATEAIIRRYAKYRYRYETPVNRNYLKT
ncbi:MAG: GAF domain-containing protein [Scytonema sp. PMC 1069.18]|nr:GAF domain-containing protein [Scytonema sp. PMC 1069.18]MEC4884138.1 GAF domain-containing protein [Scytonema sp. PMC 1070.18]